MSLLQLLLLHLIFIFLAFKASSQVSFHHTIKISNRSSTNIKSGPAAITLDNIESQETIKHRVLKGVTLSLIQATAKVIFDTLHAIFRHDLFLPAEVFDLPGRSDLSVRDATLINIIQILTNKYPIGYSVVDKYIFVYVKECPNKYNSNFDKINGNPTPMILPPESVPKIDILKDVVVKSFYNGYDKIPKEVAAGSFNETSIKNYHLVNVSPNIIERFNSITIPFSLDKSDRLTGPVPLSFRGINSPFGNQITIVIIDDFRQFNSTNAINPFDIGAATMLRDAAAGTLHGTSSANGSLVLQTKEGMNNEKEFNFISRTSISERPDLNEQAGLNASELINFQKAMYIKYGSNSLPFNSPVRNLLDKADIGLITTHQATDTLDLWSKNNLRKQLQRTLYTNSIAQQYALNFGGGTKKIKTYASFGVDNIKMSEKRNSWDRQTFMSKFAFDNDTFLIRVNVSIANIDSRDNFVSIPTSISYWNLFDQKGQPQYMPYGLNADGSYFARGSFFLPSVFNPVKEQKISDNKTNEQFYTINGKFGYTIRKGLQATFAVQKAYAIYDHKINYPVGSYYANTLINTYRTLDNTGQPVWNIPIGSIFDHSIVNSFTSQWRVQVKHYGKSGNFSYSSIAGFEKINHEIKFSSNRIYGKDINYPQSGIDYINSISLTVPAGKTDKIPNNNRQKDSADHFFNIYANSFCTFNDKYTMAAAVRTDFSNRFSYELNKLGIRLWSVSVTWDLSKELFFKSKLIHFLKCRASYGVNGNINYTILPIRSMESFNDQNVITGLIRPQSQSLTYEKIYQFNVGCDFQLLNKSVTGSLDYYRKSGVQLLNYVTENPVLGNEIIVNNSGSLRSCGIDLNLYITDVDVVKDIKYSGSLNLAYNRNIVTSKAVQKPAKDYTDPLKYYPLPGYPRESIFAYPSAGLNPLNGNPRGYLNGIVSENYSELINATNGSTIQYVGSAVPTFISNLFQTFKLNPISISVLVNAKLGYYGRMKSLDYHGLLQQVNDGTADFMRRWQKPGDELKTSIHSFLYPFDYNREEFSKGLRTYVVKADNIYLQAFQISYEFNKKRLSSLHVNCLQVMLSLNNIGFLYRANKALNPLLTSGGYSIPRSFTFTLSSKF